MSILTKVLFLLTTVVALATGNPITKSSSNNCVTFTVGSGTGCSWMCNYCATQLGTNNYYFQDNVCTYQEGGCVGTPVSGKQYTCCSATNKEEL